jgi:hypothetical protein
MSEAYLRSIDDELTTLARWLFAGVALVSGAGLAVEVAHSPLVQHLSLSYEGNVPTWFSSMLLFACALAAGRIARGAVALRKHWWGVAIVFGYASLDEAAEIHEHLGGQFDLHGVLYFDWVIWAAVLLVALAILYWPFMRRIDPKTRNRLIVAGAVYISGAVIMELPLGWWTDHAGPDTMGYALIDWLEETMEMIGASLALLALLRHREPE